MSTRRLVIRAGLAVTAGLAVAVTGSGTASAHVTAQPGEAAQGSYTKITFRVPNESPNAGTTKLAVSLPTQFPIASISTKPLPGWKAEVVKVKLDKAVKVHNTEVTEAVSTITWSADQGVRLNPGEFGEFEVSAGPLPENTDQLVLATTQTYDNGEVVSWDAPPPTADADEPEHPAPVVRLTVGAGGHDADGGHTASATSVSASAPRAGEDRTARWLGGGGLVVGALGLAVGVGAVLRGRRSTGPSA